MRTARPPAMAAAAVTRAAPALPALPASAGVATRVAARVCWAAARLFFASNLMTSAAMVSSRARSRSLAGGASSIVGRPTRRGGDTADSNTAVATDAALIIIGEIGVEAGDVANLLEPMACSQTRC